MTQAPANDLEAAPPYPSTPAQPNRFQPTPPSGHTTNPIQPGVGEGGNRHDNNTHKMDTPAPNLFDNLSDVKPENDDPVLHMSYIAAGRGELDSINQYLEGDDALELFSALDMTEKLKIMEQVNIIPNAWYKSRLTAKEKEGAFSGRLKNEWKCRLEKLIKKMGDPKQGTGTDGEFRVADLWDILH